jgi:hypothetical protein
MNLSDIELKIVTTVVDRFIDHNEATKRKDLIVKFKSPDAVDRLINSQILKALDKDDNLAPSAYGVQCAGDSATAKKAQISLELVLQALQQLYCVTPPRKQITTGFGTDRLRRTSR